MKKAGLLVMLLGMIFCIPGCGFTEGRDAVVTVIKATPTPEPTPTPEVTPVIKMIFLDMSDSSERLEVSMLQH